VTDTDPDRKDVRMSGKRRKHTTEFREQAARLVIETGRPVAHVAVGLGW
jgi:transposase